MPTYNKEVTDNYVKMIKDRFDRLDEPLYQLNKPLDILFPEELSYAIYRLVYQFDIDPTPEVLSHIGNLCKARRYVNNIVPGDVRWRIYEYNTPDTSVKDLKKFLKQFTLPIPYNFEGDITRCLTDYYRLNNYEEDECDKIVLFTDYLNALTNINNIYLELIGMIPEKPVPEHKRYEYDGDRREYLLDQLCKIIVEYYGLILIIHDSTDKKGRPIFHVKESKYALLKQDDIDELVSIATGINLSRINDHYNPTGVVYHKIRSTKNNISIPITYMYDGFEGEIID